MGESQSVDLPIERGGISSGGTPGPRYEGGKWTRLPGKVCVRRNSQELSTSCETVVGRVATEGDPTLGRRNWDVEYVAGGISEGVTPMSHLRIRDSTFKVQIQSG